MPNRMLRDWTDSARMEHVSPEAERLFVRLIMKADDFGRFHAEPRLIAGACFPLVRTATEKNIMAWLSELRAANLVFVYAADGRNYLEIRNFGQRMRSKQSRFPSHDGQQSDDCEQGAVICQQVADICPHDADICPPEEKRREEKKKRSEVASVTLDFSLLPEDLQDVAGLQDAWAGWLRHRKEIKVKTTDTSCKLQLNFLRENRADAVAILTQSTMNGWRGLFPLKEAARIAAQPKKLRQEDLI